ncbi:MAG TPA: UDP-N-acetylglucosamine 1-carboxyvinyltransferase [Candidatus Onthocola stercorigallinarum]|nr:UDP-N-acetylglucosamine 1-carboxyvinyltransferase [Candidatus Onthocola stercorigallinarum]
MKRIIIEGNHPLSGKIKIGGAKNSVVALIPAAIMATGPVKISNVPNISDKDALLEILKLLNVSVHRGSGTIEIDASNLENKVIPETLSNKLRASYYFMGALLARFKKVEMYFPGGCNIGSRPIDLHLKGFEALGATITKKNSKYLIEAKELKGADIFLDFASVGATVNIMIAASMAKGTTHIMNAAREAEISNIAELLNNMGAKIKGAGTEQITIEGVDKLHGAEIKVIPDRIEAGTYIIMGALLGDNLTIEGMIPEHNIVLLNKLQEMGVNFKLQNHKIILNKADNLKPTNVRTVVYPGFPTDLGQPIAVLLTQAHGISLFEETIWENRMGHVKYLNKMGANIQAERQHAKITGPTPLHGEEITATDLRAGAALVTAGLIAEGTTIINDAEHILRGYERIIAKLTAVGAKIKIVEV